MIDFDGSLGETVVIEEPTVVQESSILIVVGEEFDVIEKACEDKEVNENTFIYMIAIWYEPKNNIDKMPFPNFETTKEKEKFDVVDVDGKEEVIEEINF